MDDCTRYQRFASRGAAPEEMDCQARCDGASGATRYWLLRTLYQLPIPATREIIRRTNAAAHPPAAAPAWQQSLQALAWEPA